MRNFNLKNAVDVRRSFCAKQWKREMERWWNKSVWKFLNEAGEKEWKDLLLFTFFRMLLSCCYFGEASSAAKMFDSNDVSSGMSRYCIQLKISFLKSPRFAASREINFFPPSPLSRFTRSADMLPMPACMPCPPEPSQKFTICEENKREKSHRLECWCPVFFSVCRLMRNNRGWRRLVGSM